MIASKRASLHLALDDTGDYLASVPVSRPLDVRFWEKVDRSAGPAACWIWTGMRNTIGRYGRIKDGRRHVLAHRVAWALAGRGPVPDGRVLMHSCDNPACVNVAHLRLGTQSENVQDMVDKGRRAYATGDDNVARRMPWTRLRGDAHPMRARPEIVARGEDHGSSKLTAEAIAEIRRRFLGGEKQGELGKAFGVTRTAVGAIVRRETWRHIP